MRLPRSSELLRLTGQIPGSIRIAVPVCAVLCTALPMAGLVSLHGAVWSYGQPLSFLDFYDPGDGSLWSRAWMFRVAFDLTFWLLLLGGAAVLCTWLHERFQGQFSSRRAFFGFFFGVGICLAEAMFPFVYRLSDRVGVNLPPACIPSLIVSTFFGHAFGFNRSQTFIGTALVLFGCAIPGSLVFARGVRIYKPWSGLVIAIFAIALLLWVAARFLAS